MSTHISRMVILILITLVLFSGCQNEVVEIIDPPNDQVITPNSVVADLVQRTSLKDGSEDNILDKASCISLVLPVTVIVNGLEITVNSVSDFRFLEKILDELDEKNDVLDLIFPVTVILSDYTELTLQNEDELEALKDQCTEGGDDEDIECVDFKYPLTCSVYDTENQLSDVVTITNDKELHDLFEYFDDSKLCSFNFPVTLVLAGGDEIVISNNDELEDILKNAIGDCDEDDDNDYNDDDVDDRDFRAILIDGKWEITYFFDDKDETNSFRGFVFTFDENGNVWASNNARTVEGKWSSYGDDGILELELNFGMGSPFDEIQDDWHVIEFDKTIIKLKDVSGGDGSTEYLTFERPTNDNPGGENPSISNVIVEGLWMVAKYTEGDLDKTQNYNGFQLDFSPEGEVVANNANNEVKGTWSSFSDGETDHFIMDFGEVIPFDELNEDWEIVEFTENRIEFKHVSGGDGSIDKLVLERYNNNPGGNTDLTLSEVILEGEWIVASYLENEMNMTDDFQGYTLNFEANGTVIASKDNQTIEGSWSEVMDNGVRKFVMDFGEMIPFDEFNEDWEIISYNETRLELKNVSGGDGSIDKLVFERK